MNTDSFVLSFDTNQGILIEFLKQNKHEFDFSELDISRELYNPFNKKVIGKLKTETSPVLVLDSFTALRSKTYSFSYQRCEAYNDTQSAFGIQKAKQKGIQHTPKCKTTKAVCLIPKQPVQQIIQFDRIYTTLPWRNKTN